MDHAGTYVIGARQWTRTYPACPRQIRVARHAIEEFVSGCPRADDAALIVCEIATNSVLHSQSGNGGAFTLRAVIQQDDYVWLECEDGGGAWRSRENDGRPHGLDIVAALCGDTGWGVDETGTGRVVWARLDWQPAGAIGEPRVNGGVQWAVH
jgi:two-component sensor histidine kinase